nr:RNA-directed DNA polymerase, eukaryota [Tanacetum cinerariifolium]
MSRVDEWKEVIDKVQSRISKWKMKALSIGGQFTLGLMLKRLWRFYDHKNSLWYCVIKAIHGNDGNIELVRNGGAGSAKVLYPRLYALENHKEVNVRDKISNSSLEMSFRRHIRGGAEQVQFDSLLSLISSVILVPSDDRWVWTLDSTGDFTVASIRKLIDTFRLQFDLPKTRWNKYVPIKTNVLAWKIKMDALSTRLNISRRGFDIQSISYPICDDGIESSDHIFFAVIWLSSLLVKLHPGGASIMWMSSLMGSGVTGCYLSG